MNPESNVATTTIASKPKSAAATSDCEVVIIGAGPYGLSAAARSFGSLLYFVTGTKFTSNELASHISRNRNGR